MLENQLGSKVLVVDDEAEIRAGLSESLRHLGYEVEEASSGEEALYQIRTNPKLQFVLTDYKLPGLSGLDILKEVKKSLPHLPVVIMTGHGSVQNAVSAMQMGADDYLCKPFRFEDLEKIVVKSIPSESISSSIPLGTTEILTADSHFQNILQMAKRAARSSAPVLIEGPSGTGKELLARQIHEWSDRSSKAWVALNCAALPSGLLESELFGFEKGSFTGALERRTGKFEMANGGTLLLDEIGELDLILQAKLLRVLQEGEVDRIGGRKPHRVDVRVIATTNKNLAQLVRVGKFREDLYFRLYGIRFDLPALKERPNDIELLAETFLKRQAETQGRSLNFKEGTLQALKKLEWSGNVRELEHAVERAAILTENDEVSLESFHFEKTASESSPTFHLNPSEDVASVSHTIKDLERETILQCLRSHHGNRTHAAKALGMSLRTLRHKLKIYREDGIMIPPARQNQLGKFSRFPMHDAQLIGVQGDADMARELHNHRLA